MNHSVLLGIEIGGTKLQVGLGRRDGTLIAIERQAVEPARGAEGILAAIPITAARLCQREGVAATALTGVGIGFGGPVDSTRGVAIVSNQIEGWAEFPLADWVRDRFPAARVVIENDAATAALGEARSGAGRGFDPVLYVTIGSGVGGGLVVGGRIYRGSGRGAVEIGHLLVGDRWRGTTTGTLADIRLEERASGWAIASVGRSLANPRAGPPEPTSVLVQLASGRPELITTEMVVEAARQGDASALAILQGARGALAEGLAHAVTLLAPARVILGGGVSLIGDEFWFDPIRQEVDRRVFPPFRGTYEIVPAALGEAVVVHGALALAADACSR